MKKYIFFPLFAFFLVLGVEINNAQLRTPAASQLAKVSQVIGLSETAIEYSRPGIKNRVIFGGLVPYNKIWRTGANGSTIITLAEDAMIEGNKVPAGKYSIYTIPGKKEWTIILNKNLKGGMNYPEGQDQCRFKVKPKALRDKVETFLISFSEVKNNSAYVDLTWEKTLVRFKLEFDVDGKIMAQIESDLTKPTLDANWYYSAANYYYENGKDLNKALGWINKSLELNANAYWVFRVKSLIQAKLGDFAGAVETAGIAKVKAQEGKNDQYVKYNEDSIKEWSKKLKAKK